MADGALSDLSILELGEGISAPFCAKLMADLGAEVIKIETPSSGDAARQAGPFPDDIPHAEKSGLFLYLNANKRGITLDPGQPEGQDLFHRLLATADVLVHNKPPEEADRLHLAYDSLKSLNPGIIVASITPLGARGPYRGFKATPFNVCHFSGVASMIGEPDREPLALPEDQTAYLGAITAAGATLCALFARDVDGCGQDVDISEADAIGGLFGGMSVTRAFITQEATPRFHRLPFFYPNGVLPCKDGYVALVANTDDQWERLVEVMGNPEWAQEEVFKTALSRSELADALDELLMPWLMQHTKEEIFRMCQSNRVPTAPIYSAEDVVGHYHLEERGFFAEVDHPLAGRMKYPGAPFIFSETPWSLRRPAPTLGEHNREVYCDRLGLSDAEFASLESRHVI
jgi:crotonobetainyl-CoA:carnitine CoA-transferase CaiB-like acyl-CoA transferase